MPPAAAAVLVNLMRKGRADRASQGVSACVHVGASDRLSISRSLCSRHFKEMKEEGRSLDGKLVSSDYKALNAAPLSAMHVWSFFVQEATGQRRRRWLHTCGDSGVSKSLTTAVQGSGVEWRKESGRGRGGGREEGTALPRSSPGGRKVHGGAPHGRGLGRAASEREKAIYALLTVATPTVSRRIYGRRAAVAAAAVFYDVPKSGLSESAAVAERPMTNSSFCLSIALLLL